MTKKETVKWIVQIIASVATAILTALGATSCMGIQPNGMSELERGACVKVPRFALYVAKKKRVTIYVTLTLLNLKSTLFTLKLIYDNLGAKVAPLFQATK